MPDASASTVTVPPEITAKFPELVDLILRSESMNDSERQYWINILPVMTPDQIKSLRDILDNERKQLAAIDEKYANAMQGVSEARNIEDIGRERAEKKKSRTEQEAASEAAEEVDAEKLLGEIDQQG